MGHGKWHSQWGVTAQSCYGVWDEGFVCQRSKANVDKFVQNASRMHQMHMSFSNIFRGNIPDPAVRISKEGDDKGEEGTRREGQE